MKLGKKSTQETKPAMQLFVATADGFAAYEESPEGWHETNHALEGCHATCIGRQGDRLLLGTRDGLYRSEDRGDTWERPEAGPGIGYLRWLLWHPEREGRAVVGTEPAAVFYTWNGGSTWAECPEVAELRRRGGWYLPYSPRAGCVRGFAVHGSRLYGAVEQGGLLRSEDCGGTWELVGGSSGDTEERPPPALHPDVHSVEVHGSDPDLVLAPTGGGFYRSRDGGETWELLHDCYCRAVWVDPEDASHMVLGPADGVSSRGRIEVTADGGRSWRSVSELWPERMVNRFVRAGEHLFALLSDGAVLQAHPGEFAWQRVMKDRPAVEAMTTG